MKFIGDGHEPRDQDQHTPTIRLDVCHVSPLTPMVALMDLNTMNVVGMFFVFVSEIGRERKRNKRRTKASSLLQ